MIWGRARVDKISESANSIDVNVEVTPLLLRQTLAPDSQGHAEIIFSLPPTSAETVRIDLRNNEGPRFDVPADRAIPFDDVLTFAFDKLPAPNFNLVLIPDSPDIQNAAVIDLLRELKSRGYGRVQWFYPGAQGLKNFYPLFPTDDLPERFCADRLLTEDEALKLENHEFILLPTATPAGCGPGDSLRLLRFEKPAETTFVIGIADVLRAQKDSTLIKRRWFDVRETGWIAWVGSTDRLSIEAPTTPDIHTHMLRTPQSPLQPPADANALYTVRIPQTSADWRGVLEKIRTLRHGRSGPVRVEAPAPKPQLFPIAGVIEIRPEQITDLRLAGAIFLRPADLPLSGTLSIVRTKNLRGALLREKLSQLRDPRPDRDAIVILSDGVNDLEAPNLVREIVQLGYRRVYWDRGQSLTAPRKFRFDPASSTQ